MILIHVLIAVHIIFCIHACRWGCTHEQNAIEAYTKVAKESHEGFEVSVAGLFIDEKWPFVGASPDAIITCKCCGKGVLEIKCPFCFKDGLPEEDQHNFCMSQKDGKWTLKKDHSYYYQVQTQVNVCKLSYGDFVAWTERGIAVERITIDSTFFETIIKEVHHFFVYGMLPEIVGKWYTRKPVADSKGIVPHSSTKPTNDGKKEEEDYSRVWCYCGQPSFGTMILCDNNDCSIQWFHCECLRIRSPPKGRWYCPACRKLPQLNKRRSKCMQAVV